MEAALRLRTLSVPIRRPSWESTRLIAAWLFLAPTIVVLCLVAGWPLLRTFYFSFTDAQLLTIDSTANFVAFENYASVLVDASWWRAVGNTALFAFITLVLETVLGLFVASVLQKRWVGRGWLRAVVLVPWAIPTVVSAKMWSWLYHDLYGAINAFLMAFGIIDTPIAWLAGGWTAFASLIFVDVWKTTPFVALLCLAGLEAIPKDIVEASRLDSPNPWRRYFSVTLPLLAPTLFVAILFRALDALRVFDLIYVLTGTEPSTASMAVYARQRLMEFQEFGVGSAVSVLIFLIIGGLAATYVRMLASKDQGL